MILPPILRSAAIAAGLLTFIHGDTDASVPTAGLLGSEFVALPWPVQVESGAPVTDAAQPQAVEQSEPAPTSDPGDVLPFDPAVPGSELTVYLMTMGPGAFVWERFGHNAIWIHDEARQTDIAYNWGLFSFDQEGFILRFLRGHMDYWMEGVDAEASASYYMRTDRSIWVQELNLSPDQRRALLEFVEWNALPENRFYRYDYFRDNCSTRARDAIDRVLGGALQAQTDNVLTDASYRDHTRGAVGEASLLYTGIMLGLGPATDRNLTAWEEMFMPLQLMERIRDVTVETPSGEQAPLVLSERQVYRSAQLPAEPAQPPSLFGYLATGLLIASGIVASVRAAGRHRGARVAFRTITILWCSVAGLLGTVLVLLWIATDHTAAWANQNLFHFNPLLLVLALLLPMAVTPTSRRRRETFMVAALAVGLSLLGVVLGLLPWFYQENLELILLALPVNLALGYAAWFLHRQSLGAPGFPGAAGRANDRIRTKEA